MTLVWTQWAIDTFFAVSVLIALILLSRRTVIRFAGINAAYALWSLPLIRLFMPNIPVLSSTQVKAMPQDILVTAQAHSPNIERTDFGSVMAGAPTINWLYVILAIWVAGIVVALIRLSYAQHRSMQEIKLHGQKPDASIVHMSADCAQILGLKAVPNILMLKDASPMVTGFIRPTIVLPLDFSGLFSQPQQRLILLHEFAHIARRDLWAQLAATLFVIINWPNPLAHIAKRYFRLDQEAACDGRVLTVIDNERAARAAYASSLLCAVQIFTPKPTTSFSRLTSNLGAAPLSLNIHHPFKERLMMIKTHRQTPRGRRAIIALLMTTAILASAPLTPAQTTSNLAGAPVTNQQKEVAKWVVIDDDGNQIRNHYEIITENGVRRAWKIDELGNRIQVSQSEVDAFQANMPKPPEPPATVEGLRIIENYELLDDANHAGKHTIVKRVRNASSPEVISIEISKIDGDVARAIAESGAGEFDIMRDKSSGASIKVGIASRMLDDIDEEELTPEARHKLDNARRALSEAQNAMASENK